MIGEKKKMQKYQLCFFGTFSGVFWEDDEEGGQWNEKIGFSSDVGIIFSDEEESNFEASAHSFAQKHFSMEFSTFLGILQNRGNLDRASPIGI